MSDQAATASESRVPREWPGAFRIFTHSKEAVMANVGTLIWLYLIAIIFSLIPMIYKESLLIQILGYVGSAFVSAALVIVYVQGVRGQKISLSDVLNKSLPLIIPFIVLSILVMASIVLSIIALIIPFFFVLPRLMLAEYFLIDKRMGIIEAYKASWNATKGHSKKVWAIIGVNIVFVLLIIVLIGIVLLFLYAAAMAVLYEYLNKSVAASQPAAALPKQG